MWDKLFEWTPTAVSFWALLPLYFTLLVSFGKMIGSHYIQPKLKLSISQPHCINYEKFVPSIYLKITFRSFDKDVYIERIVLTIEKQETHERHEFEGTFIYEFGDSTHPQIVGPQLQFRETLSPFIVSRAQAVSKIVRFTDNSIVEKNRQIINDAQKTFRGLIDTTKNDIALAVKSFNESPTASSLWKLASDNFYFKTGIYKGTVTACTTVSKFPLDFSFEITKDETEPIGNKSSGYVARI